MINKNKAYALNDYEIDGFLTVPKTLYENPKYNELDNAAKILYAILKHIQKLNIDSNWINANDEGCLFIEYNIKELSEYMNVSTSTVNKYIKQLVKYELLIQEKFNRIYLLKPEGIHWEVLK